MFKNWLTNFKGATGDGVFNLEGTYFTPEAIARLSGYNVVHVRRLCADGTLAAIKIGRGWLVSLTALGDLAAVQHLTDDSYRHGPRNEPESAS